VFAEDEAQLLFAQAKTPDELDLLVEQRAAGAPLEHVLGWVAFCGVRIALEPGVFVPRRRTEFLVDCAADSAREAARSGATPPLILDLCCGSGALGAALHDRFPQAELYAADIDPAVVRCARRNIIGTVYEGDLFDPLPARLQGRVNVLVANTPYVPSASIELLPRDARLHEPLLALDGGRDGLDVQRRIALSAPLWLAAGGQLFVETSKEQAPASAEVFASSGLRTRIVSSAEFDATVVIATKPPSL